MLSAFQVTYYTKRSEERRAIVLLPHGALGLEAINTVCANDQDTDQTKVARAVRLYENEIIALNF